MNERVDGFVEPKDRKRSSYPCFRCITETGVVRCGVCGCPRYEHRFGERSCACCENCPGFEPRKPEIGWIIAPR